MKNKRICGLYLLDRFCGVFCIVSIIAALRLTIESDYLDSILFFSNAIGWGIAGALTNEKRRNENIVFGFE